MGEGVNQKELYAQLESAMEILYELELNLINKGSKQNTFMAGDLRDVYVHLIKKAIESI